MGVVKERSEKLATIHNSTFEQREERSVNAATDFDAVPECATSTVDAMKCILSGILDVIELSDRSRWSQTKRGYSFS